MKKDTWIIVFLVILAVHLGALWLFLASQKEESASSGARREEPAEPPRLVPEPSLVRPSGKTTAASKDRRATAPLKFPKPSRQASASIPRKFHSYDYSKAVRGNIPGLPGSRLAKAGILVEQSTGKVLWCKNPRKAVPIASMTKMMTAILAVEALRSGEVSLNERIKVTKAAARIGGSDIWLDPRETLPFGDLFKAMMMKSANDAAYLIAQRLAGGSASEFVRKMNAKAKELGLRKAVFHNPHGLPEKKLGENMESPEELAFLASLLTRYPEVLKYSTLKVDYIPRKVGRNKRTQLVNTNKLVRTGCPGVDGMKTGFTRKSGFCVTITCRRGGRRLVAVLAGFPSSKERDKFARELLDWGYKRLAAD